MPELPRLGNPMDLEELPLILGVTSGIWRPTY